LPIEKIFVDCKDNTIIVLDKTKLWKNYIGIVVHF
jgi:hypothetical protein